MKNTFDRVYEMVAQIPWGRVTTYGQIARLLGNPRLSRIVGCALHVNPQGPGLPCHRVVKQSGALSGAFIHTEGVDEQRLLLEEEGVSFTAEGRVDLALHMWYGPEDR